MSDNKFNIGDVVVLNSGGPKMVVVGIDFINSDTTIDYRCKWFNSLNDSRTDSFLMCTIKKYEKQDIPFRSGAPE